MHKTKEVKVKIIISMARRTIRDLLLEDMLIKMLKGRNIIYFMGGIMCKVKVGLKVKTMVVAIAEVTILWMSVVNLTRLLGQTLWLIHNNKLKRM